MRIISLALLVFILQSCYTKVDTFYNIDKSYYSGMSNANIIYEDDSVKIYGSFNLFEDINGLNGLKLTVEVNAKNVSVTDMSFLIKPNGSKDYTSTNELIYNNPFDDKSGTYDNFNIISEIVNDKEEYAVVFNYPTTMSVREGFTMKYDIKLKYSGQDKLLNGEQKFKKGKYKVSWLR